ncbi:uncharacterized protein LOC121858543 [Homarus americanus]|uniref:uncharacterized protein LOC121858543 n=1 Tax=Homarus americanus TaxID=6706 RepID=UPI001C48AF5C|nr:uncharacterized protein LOC121858543 [Homarus americanus]
MMKAAGMMTMTVGVMMMMMMAVGVEMSGTSVGALEPPIGFSLYHLAGKDAEDWSPSFPLSESLTVALMTPTHPWQEFTFGFELTDGTATGSLRLRNVINGSVRLTLESLRSSSLKQQVIVLSKEVSLKILSLTNWTFFSLSVINGRLTLSVEGSEVARFDEMDATQFHQVYGHVSQGNYMYVSFKRDGAVTSTSPTPGVTWGSPTSSVTPEGSYGSPEVSSSNTITVVVILFLLVVASVVGFWYYMRRRSRRKAEDVREMMTNDDIEKRGVDKQLKEKTRETENIKSTEDHESEPLMEVVSHGNDGVVYNDDGVIHGGDGVMHGDDGVMPGKTYGSVLQNTQNFVSQNTQDVVSQNTQDVVSQNTQDVVSQNTQDVCHKTHKMYVSQNTQDVSQNTQDVSQNTQDVSQNTQDVSQNTQDVSQNTQDVSQNTQDDEHGESDATSFFRKKHEQENDTNEQTTLKIDSPTVNTAGGDQQTEHVMGGTKHPKNYDLSYHDYETVESNKRFSQGKQKLGKQKSKITKQPRERPYLDYKP